MGGSANIGDLLYGREGGLIYGSPQMPLYKDLFEHLWIMTEWVFDNQYDGDDTALINGVEVCVGHSTSHIIDYNIGILGSEVVWSDEYGGYLVPFTMGIVVREGHIIPADEPCEFHCWAKDYPEIEARQTGKFGDTKDFTLIYAPDAEGAAQYRIVNGRLTGE